MADEKEYLLLVVAAQHEQGEGMYSRYCISFTVCRKLTIYPCLVNHPIFSYGTDFHHWHLWSPTESTLLPKEHAHLVSLYLCLRLGWWEHSIINSTVCGTDTLISRHQTVKYILHITAWCTGAVWTSAPVYSKNLSPGINQWSHFSITLVTFSSYSCRYTQHSSNLFSKLRRY